MAADPDWLFDRLRKENPERYETAAGIAPDRWMHRRSEVSGTSAKLYLDRRRTPTLIVSDLKPGANHRGGVGLWIETAPRAHFRKLKSTTR